MTQITILVPVLNRPQNAMSLVESIRAHTLVPHQILFLCSPGDNEQALACVETGADADIVGFENGPGDWAKKINHGFNISYSEFCLLGADDLRFHPGWDTEALRIADETGAGVIGTNDLGNATVMRGMHSTHPLVRRAYVDEQGTIDEPGKCLHEGYAHQWVDNELIVTAQMRKQWAFAALSHVEHMHPYWKKGKMDATYEKALSTSKEDNALFRSRQHLWSRAAFRAKARA
jgi:glycosyltransferase involved in cell wall biosynthesis